MNLFMVKDVAEKFKVDEQTVYRWIREKKINYMKLASGSIRFTKDHIESFVVERGACDKENVREGTD